MERIESGLGRVWVPSACTLPPGEWVARAAEFDALFGRGVLGAERVGVGRLRVELEFSPAAAAVTADLVARESGCCSFFSFTLLLGGGRLELEVGVPEPHVAVLDTLEARAVASAGTGGAGTSS